MHRWKRNGTGLEQCCYKCWQGGRQQVWKQLLQLLTAILLLQAVKKPSQLLLGGCFTFSNNRGDFSTRKPGCKTKRQEFLFWPRKCLKKTLDLGNGFL